MKLPSAYKHIPGWFTPNEANYLYKIVCKMPGDILEAGTFCGRSTSCICEALKDHPRKFVSYDVACSSAEEFKRFALTAGQGSDIYIPPELAELWNKGTNSHEQAQAYLREAGLLDYVTLIKGDFRSDLSSYGVLFFDTTHGPEEIAINMPHILRLAKKGAWVTLHDMYPPLLAMIEAEYGKQLKFEGIADTLGLFTRL